MEKVEMNPSRSVVVVVGREEFNNEGGSVIRVGMEYFARCSMRNGRAIFVGMRKV